MSEHNTVVLDNEAVQALANAQHRKHRKALGFVQGISRRNVRRRTGIRLVVPTSVRVEAGWDRTARRAAAVNGMHIADMPLDGTSADRAARLRTALDVSVADAHLGAVLASTPGPHVVLTSDADDVRRLADQVGAAVRVVVI